MSAKRTTTASATHRPRRAPDRLGPLEVAIGVLVLAVALSLVLVSRSVASRTTATAPPAAVRVAAPAAVRLAASAGPPERRLVPEDTRSEPAARGDAV
ncbi:MAG: hypothetical protein ACM3OO_05270 [Planctomycetaceae bacterium]